ncbi:hypothetical protein TGPRC2_320030 [Toxoplasma gondii TgCatPRC2]|uniref:Uncharacterized protein n=1 Tax=Toxoplasma gondii TgCatPRC2 TaxID=1130821 RepID=A0A151HBV6_TOXGO|nr:hypothetical protein TGPRC2_320030 [Toxoplasma gondii TgCatPRC2]
MKHESSGFCHRTPRRAHKGRLWRSRDSSTDTTDSGSSGETVICTRKCHQHRAFSRFEKEKALEKLAIEQTCRPPLDRIPIVRQPLAVTPADFNPVPREDGRLVRRLWHHARDAVERPKVTRPFEWTPPTPQTPRGHAHWRSTSCPPVRRSAGREGQMSWSKSRGERRISGSVSDRGRSGYQTVSIGRSRTPEYVRHYLTYGVDGPGYETMHKGMLQDTGMTYTRQYELPTISRFLSAKHPIFLRARSGSLVIKKKTRRRPAPPPSESSSSESEESVFKDGDREEVTKAPPVSQAPNTPAKAVSPPPASTGVPLVPVQGQWRSQTAGPAVVVTPSVGSPVLLMPSQAQAVPATTQQKPHLQTNTTPTPSQVTQTRNPCKEGLVDRQERIGSQLPLTPSGYDSSQEMCWDSGRFTQHLNGAQRHPSFAAPGVPFVLPMPTHLPAQSTPRPTQNNYCGYLSMCCTPTNSARSLARPAAVHSQRREASQPVLVPAAPSAFYTSGNTGGNRLPGLSARPPAGQQWRKAGTTLETGSPMTPAMKRSELFRAPFQSGLPVYQTRASVAPGPPHMQRLPVSGHPKPGAVSACLSSHQKTPIEAEIIITPPRKGAESTQYRSRSVSPVGDRGERRSILKNTGGPTRASLQRRSQSQVTFCDSTGDVGLEEELARNADAGGSGPPSAFPTRATDQRVMGGAPPVYQIANPLIGHPQLIQGILTPGQLVCIGPAPSFPPPEVVSPVYPIGPFPAVPIRSEKAK